MTGHWHNLQNSTFHKIEDIFDRLSCKYWLLARYNCY